jgi:hypothetical protein
MVDRATEYTGKAVAKTRQRKVSFQSLLENGQQFRNQPDM